MPITTAVHRVVGRRPGVTFLALVYDTDQMEEQLLVGGVATREGCPVGSEVLRPSNPHSPAIHWFLRAVRDAGFSGASLPVGIDENGRERPVFIEGDVPVPPYPAWARTIACWSRRPRSSPGSMQRRRVRPDGTDLESRAGRSDRRPDRLPQRRVSRERCLRRRCRRRAARLRLLRPGPPASTWSVGSDVCADRR